MNVLKRKLPLGAVALLLVLALAAIGITYGNWTQTLTIGGIVTTGGVSAEWNQLIEKCSDSDGEGAIGGPGKNWAQMTRVVKADGKTLNVTVTNGYPNYFADCEWEVLYTGQTPGVISSVTFDEKLLNCNVLQTVGGSFTAICGEVLPDRPEFEVRWVDGIGCTALALQDGVKEGGSLHVEILKFAKEKANYDFNIDLEVVQWDKAIC